MRKAAEVISNITHFHSKQDYEGMSKFFRSLTPEEVDNLQQFANELDIVCRKLKRGMSK